MTHFLIRRIAGALLVLVVVALIAFVLFRFVGDPINQMVGPGRQRRRPRAAARIARLERFADRAARALPVERTAFRLRRVLPVQGNSVTALVGARFPATFELAVAASLFAIAVGIPLGVFIPASVATPCCRACFMASVARSAFRCRPS